MRRRIRSVAVMALACLLSACLCMPAFADEEASQVATSDEYGGREAVDADGMVPVSGEDVADGTYHVLVKTDTQMFNIVDCELTVENGTMSAVITLSSDGYRWVYLGTGAQAAAAEQSAYAEYVEDEQGRYTYDIGEVPALNATVQCCCYSKRREQWYDHDIVFIAGTLPDAALSDAAQRAVRESSPLHGLADGDYQVAVDVFGGEDTVESPAPMTMRDGEATATLRFSSANYHSITMAGEVYEPTEASGDAAVFEIPIRVFDTAIPVVFESESEEGPTELAGSLSFHSGQVSDAAGNAVKPVDAAADASDDAGVAAVADDAAADAAGGVEGDGAPASDGGSMPIGITAAIAAVACVLGWLVTRGRRSRTGSGEGDK